MKTMREMIREASMSPLRVDIAIIKAVEELGSNTVKIGRVKTACQPLSTNIITTRLKELEEKGYIVIHRQNNNNAETIFSIELTILGKLKIQ